MCADKNKCALACATRTRMRLTYHSLCICEIDSCILLHACARHSRARDKFGRKKVQTHTHIHAYTIHAYTHTPYTHTRIHAYMHTCIHANTHTHTNTAHNVQMYIHTYTYTRIETTHKCRHTYIQVTLCLNRTVSVLVTSRVIV
jgi:hypothetical protein